MHQNEEFVQAGQTVKQLIQGLGNRDLFQIILPISP